MTELDGVDAAALVVVCERFGIAEFSVLGSAASGRMSPDSDIDVLDVLRDGVHLGWAINDLSDDLEQVMGRWTWWPNGPCTTASGKRSCPKRRSPMRRDLLPGWQVRG